MQEVFDLVLQAILMFTKVGEPAKIILGSGEAQEFIFLKVSKCCSCSRSENHMCRIREPSDLWLLQSHTSNPVFLLFHHKLPICRSFGFEACMTLFNSTFTKCCLFSPAQLFVTPWTVDCSPPGSSVHGILQTRILDWVVVPSSRRSSQPRDQTNVSYVSCVGRQVLYH